MFGAVFLLGVAAIVILFVAFDIGGLLSRLGLTHMPLSSAGRIRARRIEALSISFPPFLLAAYFVHSIPPASLRFITPVWRIALYPILGFVALCWGYYCFAAITGRHVSFC